MIGSFLLCVIVLADVLLASPVTSYGSYNGAAQQQARSADSAFAFKLPQAHGNDQSSDLASQVSSLSNSGRSYGLGSLPADKDAIVYPDEIIRDSYGNVAKPYVPLSEKTHATADTAGQGVGFQTDVNKDQTHHNTPSGEKVPWVLPSYAGGILQPNVNTPQLELQPPPLSSGNFNYPSVPSLPSAATIPSVPNSAAKPGVPSSIEDNLTNEVTPSQGHSYHDSTQQAGPQPPAKSVPVPTDTPKHPNPSNGAIAPLPTSERSEYEKNYSHGKYHGGFGGAAGVLGDQQELGYAVKKEETHTSGNEHAPTPTPTYPEQTSAGVRPGVIDLSNNPTLVVPKPVPAPAPAQASSTGNYGGVVSQGSPHGSDHKTPNGPSVQNGPIPSNVPATPAPGKYSGSFGGAPGVLGDQTKPGYATVPADNNGQFGSNPHSSTVPQPNVDSLVPPQSTYNNAPNYHTGSIGSNSAQQPSSVGPQTPPQSTYNNAPNYQAGATGTIPPQHTSSVGSLPPSQVPPQSTYNHSPNYQTGVTASNTVQPSGQQTPTHSGSAGAHTSPPSGPISSYGSNSPTYNSYGGSTAGQPPSSASSLDSILGNQNQIGFAVGGSSQHQPSTPAPRPEIGSHSTSNNQAILDAILGNQKQPGFAVGGSGSHQSPHQQPSAPAPQPTYGGHPAGGHHDSSPAPGKYTGGFGGPPGALSPYDNSASGAPAPVAPVTSHSYAGPNRKY